MFWKNIAPDFILTLDICLCDNVFYTNVNISINKSSTIRFVCLFVFKIACQKAS